jgi:thiaminase
MLTFALLLALSASSQFLVEAADPDSLDFPETPFWSKVFLDNNPALQFASPDWNEDDFHYYVLQDGLYLEYYPRVYNRLLAFCPNQPYAVKLVNKSREKTFTLPDYEVALGVNYTSAADHISSQVLKDYIAHYENQNTCQDLISAMLPCLCLYPPIVSTLAKSHEEYKYAQLAKKWISYNTSKGTSCKLAQRKFQFQDSQIRWICMTFSCDLTYLSSIIINMLFSSSYYYYYYPMIFILL